MLRKGAHKRNPKTTNAIPDELRESNTRSGNKSQEHQKPTKRTTLTDISKPEDAKIGEIKFPINPRNKENRKNIHDSRTGSKSDDNKRDNMIYAKRRSSGRIQKSVNKASDELKQVDEYGEDPECSIALNESISTIDAETRKLNISIREENTDDENGLMDTEMAAMKISTYQEKMDMSDEEQPKSSNPTAAMKTQVQQYKMDMSAEEKPKSSNASSEATKFNNTTDTAMNISTHQEKMDVSNGQRAKSSNALSAVSKSNDAMEISTQQEEKDMPDEQQTKNRNYSNVVTRSNAMKMRVSNEQQPTGSNAVANSNESEMCAMNRRSVRIAQSEANTTPQVPVHRTPSYITFGGTINYFITSHSIGRMAAKLIEWINRHPHIKTIPMSFDMEWPFSFKTGAGKSAVMQLCVETNSVYIFQLTQLDMLPIDLIKLLKHPKLRLHGVNIKNDFRKLARDFPEVDANVLIGKCIDLGLFCNQVCDTSGRWSLDRLAKYILDQTMDKSNKVRLSKWDKYPLNKEQLMYAAIDAQIGQIIYRELEIREQKKKKHVEDFKKRNGELAFKALKALGASFMERIE